MYMSTATALLVVLAFLFGCVTWWFGFRVAYEQSPLASLLYAGAFTFVLQFAAACLAVIHARASRAVEDDPEAAPGAEPVGGLGEGSPGRGPARN